MKKSTIWFLSVVLLPFQALPLATLTHAQNTLGTYDAASVTSLLYNQGLLPTTECQDQLSIPVNESNPTGIQNIIEAIANSAATLGITGQENAIRLALQTCDVNAFFTPCIGTQLSIDQCAQQHYQLAYLCPQAHPEVFILSETVDELAMDSYERYKANAMVGLLQPTPDQPAIPLNTRSRVTHYGLCQSQREDYISDVLSPNLGDAQTELNTANDDAGLKTLKEEKIQYEKMRKMALRGIDLAKKNNDSFAQKNYQKTPSSPEEDITQTTAEWQTDADNWQTELINKTQEINQYNLPSGQTYQQVQWAAKGYRQHIDGVRSEIRKLEEERLRILTSSIDIDSITIGDENRLSLTTDLGTDSNGNSSTVNVIERATRIIIQVIGTLGVLLIVIGGFILVTSNGSDTQISQAKTIIKSTLIGLVIAFMSYTIVQLIFGFLF